MLLTHFITFQSSELNKRIFHVSDALSAVPGTRASENKLRETVKVIRSSFSLSLDIQEVHIVSLSLQKYVNKARRLVGLLGCTTNTEDAASSSRAVQDDEEESNDDDDAEEDEEEGAEEEHGEEEEEDDEEEEYDDDDGPPATQPTQREKRNVPKKDCKRKACPTHRKKTVAEKRSKNNEDRTSKRGWKE